MKVYVIYDTESLEHPEVPGGAVGPLGKSDYMVAFSGSKKLASKYISCRKKKVFKMKTYKMSKEEFTELSNNYALRRLTEFEIVTRVDGSHTSVKEVKIVMTPAEYNLVTDEQATLACKDLTFYPINFFTNKFAKALLYLEYGAIAALNETTVSMDNGELLGWELDDGLPDAALDELAVYITLNMDEFK